MKLLDFDTLTDTDLKEMLERKIPCEFAKRMVAKGGRRPSWCTESATHWVRITCRSCNKTGRVFTCLPCTKFFYRGLKTLGVMMIPWMRHGSCRFPVTFRVSTGPL